MSVSQFPNASMSKVEEIIDLFDQLLPNLDPALEADIEVVASAFMCAAVQYIMAMPALPQYHKLDSAIVRKIESVIQSCT
jgi:hypothetical protein